MPPLFFVGMRSVKYCNFLSGSAYIRKINPDVSDDVKQTAWLWFYV